MIPQPIHPTDLRRAEYERSAFLVRPKAGTPFSAVLAPDFWGNVSGQMKAGDLVEVLAEDGSYDALLRVMRVERLFAKVRVLRYWDPQMEAEGAPVTDEGYRVEFGGKVQKWRVVDPNGALVSDKHDDEGEARAALAAFLRAKSA